MRNRAREGTCIACAGAKPSKQRQTGAAQYDIQRDAAAKRRTYLGIPQIRRAAECKIRPNYPSRQLSRGVCSVPINGGFESTSNHFESTLDQFITTTLCTSHHPSMTESLRPEISS